ncbi:MAG: hypothetical protein AB7G87_01100 [Clostridia bacterium]
MFQLSIFEDVPIVPKVSLKTMEKYNKLITTLEDDFKRHNDLLVVGGTDPFWPDGTNLHLKRNHILNGKRQLEEFNREYGLELPGIYFRDTPEEVDREYQAPNSLSGKHYVFRNKNVN